MESLRWAHDPIAVGPHQYHAPFAGLPHHLLLEALPIPSDLSKPRCDHDPRLDSFCHTFPDYRWNGTGWNNNNRQIRHLGDICDLLVRLKPLYPGLRWVYRINRSCKTAIYKIWTIL